ncbi:uncharacterized protein LOC118496544 [Sander lucioperca]|uniref:uncharacterized protein LOC118496544 n=1 Tax=Sander lucioperca TaxID=283035 RepID=UPI0016535797|nr:uncharacterized protein LOC118496544 [Sander lucioperca]
MTCFKCQVDLMSKDSIIIPAWSPQPGKADHYLLCVLQPAKRELFLLDSLKPDGFGDSHNIFRFGNMTTISPVLWLVQYGNPTEFIVLQKCSDLAHHIALGQWTTKFGKDIEGFPQQTTVNYCGILMLMYALSLSTEAPFWFIERDMARIRKWWCISLMERFQIDGCQRVLSEILQEVLLQEGDKAYLTLALVCTTFRDTVSTNAFRRRAHFQWLDSVATWRRFSASYKKEFYTMYTVDTCRECGMFYKNCTPGYVGTGKRGTAITFAAKCNSVSGGGGLSGRKPQLDHIEQPQWTSAGLQDQRGMEEDNQNQEQRSNEVPRRQAADWDSDSSHVQLYLQMFWK